MAENRNAEAAGGRSRPPTIATIAARLGLSRATVTHVLNGRATEQRIRPETQQRVLEVAEALGYRANASARAIRAGRFGSLALILSQLGLYMPDELLHGLTAAIAAHDLHLVLTEVPDVDTSGEAYVAQAMRELSVDGVFVNRHSASQPPFLERLHKLHLPAIFLNSKQDFDSVYPDDLAGGVLATEYLLQLGHERIAYVESDFPHQPHFSRQDRRLGYVQAMASAGRAAQLYWLPLDWRTPNDLHADQRVAAAAKLLSGLERPTAVVAYEMTEAMAVVRAAYLLGLRIPQDLSLIHFHNRIDDRCFVPIHTVSNRMKEVGESAVEMLLEKIRNPEQALRSKVVPEVLLEGATCLPFSTRSQR